MTDSTTALIVISGTLTVAGIIGGRILDDWTNGWDGFHCRLNQLKQGSFKGLHTGMCDAFNRFLSENNRTLGHDQYHRGIL